MTHGDGVAAMLQSYVCLAALSSEPKNCAVARFLVLRLGLGVAWNAVRSFTTVKGQNTHREFCSFCNFLGILDVFRHHRLVYLT